MDTISFKEKQKLFQRKAEENSLKLAKTFNLKESKKTKINKDLTNSVNMENKYNKKKSSENLIENINNIPKEKKSTYDNKELSKKILAKSSINEIKLKMEQFMVKKENEKYKENKENKEKEKNNVDDINIGKDINEIKEIKENKNNNDILIDSQQNENINDEEEIKEEKESEKNNNEIIDDNINENIENQDIDNNIVIENNNNNEEINEENNIINNQNQNENEEEKQVEEEEKEEKEEKEEEKEEENEEQDIINENENKEEENNSFLLKQEELELDKLKEVKEEFKYDNNNNNIKINIYNNIDNDNEIEINNINNNNNLGPKNISLNIKLEKKNLDDLDIDNFKDFKEEYYLNRKYDKRNYDKGKIFFKYRYLKDKYIQISETILRLTTGNYYQDNNIKDRFSLINTSSLSSKEERHSQNKFKLKNNYYLSFFINNPSNQCLNTIDKDTELRHYHSQFLKITENTILYFNLKQYEESYLSLYSNGIIKDPKEFGEFLLVANGFDKFIIGEFLSKKNIPNEKKEVLKGFVNAIKMKYEEINFLECFRFFMKRLYLPKDANLILEIMNTFCLTYFENNKSNEEFLNIFKSSNNIYLLISTLLAVNTMFTRKDIKNLNIIKKEEFINMNKDINEIFLNDVYDQLKNNPLEIEVENYNENVYKRMTTLIKENFLRNSKNKKNNINNININTNKNNNEISTKNNNDSDSNEENDCFNDFNPLDFNNGELYKDSINLTKNLFNFSEQDQKILLKIQTFHKFVGEDFIHEREFLVHNNYTRLIWGKNMEINKDKNNVHSLPIKEIIDVFNGIEHSKILKKYVSANPKEMKEKNHYITIITHKIQINLKSDSLQIALLWYKALKSLVLKVKLENKAKNNKIKNELNTKTKKIEEIWKEFILPNWNIYGNYILKKIKRRNELKEEKMLSSENIKMIETIINDLTNNKKIDSFDFFRLYRIGIPSFCRATIWKILIGNSSCITENLYENYLNKIEKVDFKEFDLRYQEDNNTIFNFDYNVNKMIVDVIKEKEFFKDELIKYKINIEQIMIKSYNILRVFYLIRNDLIYKKSIIPLIFVFLIVEEDEFNVFCDIYNLICNNDIIKFYIEDEAYIIKSLNFFTTIVEKNLPQIHKHFKNLEISYDLFFISWITELFSSTLDLKLLLRIIDLYLLDGEYILYQAGITILAIQEDDILDLTISEILNLVKRLPDKYGLIPFLKKMKKFDSVLNEYVKMKNEDELGAQKLLLFKAIFNDDN